MELETTTVADGDSPATDRDKPSPLVVAVGPDLAQSPALQRLLEEIANEDDSVAQTAAYNRTHNRHNRHR